MRKRIVLLAAIVIACGCHTSFDTGQDSATDTGPDTPADLAGDTRPDGADTLSDTSVDVDHDDVLVDWGECWSDSDCPPGTSCVRVPDEPGGYRLCTWPPREEATECTSPDPWVDQCCTGADCDEAEEGECFFSEWGWGFYGGAVMDHNMCIYDECMADSHCTMSSPSVCLPRDLFDWPRRRCAYGSCRTALDCGPGGYCKPLTDWCCPWMVAGFWCVYPGRCSDHDECIDYEACIGDPSDGGTHCDMIACPG